MGAMDSTGKASSRPWGAPTNANATTRGSRRCSVGNLIPARMVSRIGDYPFWNATWL